jgi:hypothetical protein
LKLAQDGDSSIIAIRRFSGTIISQDKGKSPTVYYGVSLVGIPSDNGYYQAGYPAAGGDSEPDPYAWKMFVIGIRRLECPRNADSPNKAKSRGVYIGQS